MLKLKNTLKLSHLQALKKGKNLLAFSYGSDSTALFYSLLNENINFDLALVNYKTRTQSDTEEQRARLLAKEFHKKIFVAYAPEFKANFESKARTFRYDFFTKLCFEHHYENLILAHQLNDEFEWFLMQLGKGAGLMELLGMKAYEKGKNFSIIRPLLQSSKKDILNFLKYNKLFFFQDQSNEKLEFKRNFIRIHFAQNFMELFDKGVKRSFSYLKKEKALYFDEKIAEFEGVLFCKINESVIAKALKRKGLCPSAAQRKEMLKTHCVLSAKIALCFYEELALIFNYEKIEKMPKNYKERYRKLKLPKFIRAYLYKHNVDEKALLKALQDFKASS